MKLGPRETKMKNSDERGKAKRDIRELKQTNEGKAEKTKGNSRHKKE